MIQSMQMPSQRIHRLQKSVQKGFTLIELMIVVAIIGILAAVALPAYQDYIVRAKVSKVVTVADPIKTALAEYYQTNGSWPAAMASGGDWQAIGLGATQTISTNEVTSVSIAAGGIINLTMRNIKGTAIDGLLLTFTPDVSDRVTVKWNATSTSTDPAITKALQSLKAS